MPLFKKKPAVQETGPVALAEVSSGWLDGASADTKGEKVSVSVQRTSSNLRVIVTYAGLSSRADKRIVWEGVDARPAISAANKEMSKVRGQGYRARRPDASDADFSIADTCKKLGVKPS